MKKSIFLILATIFLLICDQVVAQEYLAIQNATIISSANDEPIQKGTVILKDGIIEKVGLSEDLTIPENATLVDATGKWVIPGLIEAHSHSKSRNDFKVGLALGITTAHVLPTNPDTALFMEIWASKPTSLSPRLVQNSWMFSGIWPDDIAPGAWRILKPVTKSEAISQVEKVKRKGFSSIKIFMEDGNVWHTEPKNTKVLSDSVLVAIIERANELNMRVYGHAWDTTYYNQLVRQQVDAIIHPAVNALIEDEIWELMRFQNMPWITTASILERIGAMGDYYSRILNDTSFTKLLDDESIDNYSNYSQMEVAPFIGNFPILKTDLQNFYDILWENTINAQSHGVIIALGSDNSVGFGTHIEMEMLQENGLSPKEILNAATYGGALALGMEDGIGSIEIGKRGDLVVLNSNPFDDIKNTRNVFAVVKSGKLYHQEDIVAFK
jgi:imidazolonepropionase-like amidohydrolase